MQPVTFVAEFTTNHMGNLNVLLRMVEMAAGVGCDYVKMQKKDVETFYSREKLDSPFSSPYGKTYRDYRTIFEFGEEDFDRFDQHCKKLGLQWFSSVQDLPSLHFMLKYDLPLYKVASCKARDRSFLAEMAHLVPKSSAIVLSVAGSTLSEIEEALTILDGHAVHLLHCVAEYPCPPCLLRLGNIPLLQERFASDRISVGYSGHEEGYIPTLAAVELGARMIERHFCLSRNSFVHHIDCSLEPSEFRELTDMVRMRYNFAELTKCLPACVFDSEFGMSARERDFLVEGTYSHVADIARGDSG